MSSTVIPSYRKSISVSLSFFFQCGCFPYFINVFFCHSFSDIRYGIKFAEKNIGFNGKYYTFPWFLSFLLKKFLQLQQL